MSDKSRYVAPRLSRFTSKTDWKRDEQDQPAVGLFCVLAAALTFFFLLSIV